MDPPLRVLKRGGRYISVTSGRLKFLDILQFMAAGCSLVKYLETFPPDDGGKIETKSHFPYAALTELKDLDGPLPTFDMFKDVLSPTGHAFVTTEYARYNELRETGLSDKEVLKRLGLSAPPESPGIAYKRQLDEWKQLKLYSMRDVLRYYSRFITKYFY